MSEVWCDRCARGPFDGNTGLRIHTSAVHGTEVEPRPVTDAECCAGRTRTTPGDRVVCDNCGRVLRGDKPESAEVRKRDYMKNP